MSARREAAGPKSNGKGAVARIGGGETEENCYTSQLLQDELIHPES